MARLLGDKAMSFYIKDFVILPEKQARGNGKMLMNTKSLIQLKMNYQTDIRSA